MNSLYGKRIIESEFALKETDVPMKSHKKKNQNPGYHKRIAKKWLKKFGTKKEPCIFDTPQGFIVHPSVMNNLKNAMR